MTSLSLASIEYPCNSFLFLYCFFVSLGRVVSPQSDEGQGENSYDALCFSFFSLLPPPFTSYDATSLFLPLPPPLTSLLSTPLSFYYLPTGLFKPIKSSISPSDLHRFYTPSEDCSTDLSSYNSPRPTQQSLCIPPIYPANRTSLNMQKFPMENQAALSDDDCFLINQLAESHSSSQTLKRVCPFRPSITPNDSSSFFSVTRIFEEDLSSLLNQHASFFNEDIGVNRNQTKGVRGDEYTDFGLMNRDNADFSSATTHNNNINTNNNNTNQIHSHNKTNTHTTTTTNHPHHTSEAISRKDLFPSSPPNFPPPSIPTTPSLYSSFSNDLADYSLLDDGDNGDILSFLGFKNQKWTVESDQESAFDSSIDGDSI